MKGLPRYATGRVFWRGSRTWIRILADGAIFQCHYILPVNAIIRNRHEMQEKLDIKNMTISDQPKVNDVPVSPSKKMNTAIGAMAGLLLSCGYVFLQYLFDKRLKTKAEAESFLGVPVLGEIPWFED